MWIAGLRRVNRRKGHVALPASHSTIWPQWLRGDQWRPQLPKAESGRAPWRAPPTTSWRDHETARTSEEDPPRELVCGSAWYLLLLACPVGVHDLKSIVELILDCLWRCDQIFMHVYRHPSIDKCPHSLLSALKLYSSHLEWVRDGGLDDLAPHLKEKKQTEEAHKNLTP